MHFLHACEWSTNPTSSQGNAACDKLTKRSTSKNVHNIREGAHPRLHQKPEVSPKFESFQYFHHWNYRSLNRGISCCFYSSCLCHAVVECCGSICMISTRHCLFSTIFKTSQNHQNYQNHSTFHILTCWVHFFRCYTSRVMWFRLNTCRGTKSIKTTTIKAEPRQSQTTKTAITFPSENCQIR